MSTTPAEDATKLDASTISVKVTLSEAFDEDNRRRFEDALRILPADREAVGQSAAGTAAATPFTDLEDTTNTLRAVNRAGQGNVAVSSTLANSDFMYAIGKGVLFLEDSSTRASITWSSDHKEATLTFNAPLLASSNDPAKYNIALVNVSTDVIKDKDNHQLGTVQNATSLSAKYTTLNELIYNAFKAKDLAVHTNTNAFTRWEDTHDNAATFEVKEDDDAPILQSATVSTVGSDTRFELSFNEPIAAYDGSASGASFLKSLSAGSFISNKSPLSFFTFAVGRAGRLKDFDLRGGVDVKAELYASGGGNQFVLVDRDISLHPLGSTAIGGQEEEFQLADPTYRWTGRAGAGVTDVVVEVDSRDPKTLLITLFGRNLRQVFDADMTEIKARVVSLKDPAGNAISKGSADRHVVLGRM